MACADLAMGLRNFAYAMQINPADAANEVDQASATWAAATTPQTAGGTLNFSVLGARCNPTVVSGSGAGTGAPSFDFIIALRP
jgi:hypothetical protein